MGRGRSPSPRPGFLRRRRAGLCHHPTGAELHDRIGIFVATLLCRRSRWRPSADMALGRSPGPRLVAF